MPTMPPRNPTPDTLQRKIADLEREIRLLKTHAHVDDNPPQYRREVTFSHPGVVTTLTSGKYLVKDMQATIMRVDITAGTTSSEKSTVDLMVNGDVVATLELAAGEDADTIYDLDAEVEEYDRLSVKASPGAGLADVVVAVTLMAMDEETV